MKNKLKKIILFTFVSITIFSCSNTEDVESQIVKKQVINSARPDNPPLVSQTLIGNQIWMVRNLDVSRYRNGDIIPQVQDNSSWTNLTFGAWCYYANNTANGIIYGKLYNWYAINDARGLAPVGWHIPSETEYNSLMNYLDGPFAAGGKMKSTTSWNLPNVGATNASGFTALPGGYRNNSNGLFSGKGSVGLWWTSTGLPESENQFISNVHIDNAFAQLLIESKERNAGLSVRCVKN